MPQDRQIGGNRGGDAFDDHLVECPNRAGDRRWAVTTPDDQLADEVVVVLADLVARLVPRVEPHAESVGRLEHIDRPRGWQELASGRVLGVDPNLDAVTATLGGDLVLRHRQTLARGDANLPFDQVDAGDHLGDRMLDLQSGVHLQEEELAVLIDELNGACVEVADSFGSLDRRVAHRRFDAIGQARRRSLFHELLVATLCGAVTA